MDFTVVVLYVCLSAHAILAVHAINERYHRVKHQICCNMKMAFFLIIIVLIES